MGSGSKPSSGGTVAISGVNGHLKEERRLRYWQIEQAGVLETDTRREIYELALESPGGTATDYAREVGVDRTTAEYHLEILEYFDYVNSERRRGRLRYEAAGSSEKT